MAFQRQCGRNRSNLGVAHQARNSRNDPQYDRGGGILRLGAGWHRIGIRLGHGAYPHHGAHPELQGSKAFFNTSRLHQRLPADDDGPITALDTTPVWQLTSIRLFLAIAASVQQTPTTFVKATVTCASVPSVQSSQNTAERSPTIYADAIYPVMISRGEITATIKHKRFVRVSPSVVTKSPQSLRQIFQLLLHVSGLEVFTAIGEFQCPLIRTQV